MRLGEVELLGPLHYYTQGKAKLCIFVSLFHGLSSVGFKQLCAFAQQGCSRKAGTF